MIDALQYDFMQNAFAAGLLASLICGVMGTIVVVNRIVFLSGGIAHAAYGGIGMAIFFEIPLILGTALFSTAAAVVMAAVTLKARHRSDTIIGVIWATGMAVGIILTDLTPGYNVDLMSYLFGSILTVPRSDLWMMLGLTLVLLVFVIFFYKDILALSYDEEFARLRNVPVKRLYFFQIVLLALSIVLIIRVVGLILVIALLTIPPFITERFAKSVLAMMAGSTLLGMVFSVSGLFLAFRYDLTSGASIILVAGAFFFLFLLADRLLGRR